MTDSLGTTIGSTSSSLLTRVKARDEQAWRRLVGLYGPLAAAWINRAGLQSADAGDVLQEVFQAVANGIDGFHRHQPGSFRGWLWTIVRHELVNHFRRQAAQPDVPAGGSEAHRRLQEIEGTITGTPMPAPADEVRELRLRALELIRTEFEPRVWEMFWRTAINEEVASDVAKDLGVTASAVRLAKSRVLRRLREELERL